MSSSRIRESCSALPQGWQREAVKRTHGVSSGRIDVYYHGPNGQKIKSKGELIKELGDRYDLSTFDYTAGKMHSSLIKPGGKSRKTTKKTSNETSPSTNLNNLTPPIRQTASIFKQPVTVFKSHETKVKNLKSDKDKPRQLFWERRLNNISPDIEADNGNGMELPKSVQELDWLRGRSSTNTLLASISTALHLDKRPIVGQEKSSVEIEQNHRAHLNPDQPLISSLEITEKEIKEQEERVNQARVKLARAVKALG